MDRKTILDARIRFEPNQPGQVSLAWDFYATRNVRHGGGPVTQRKFRLLFNPGDRSFFALAVRRVSKRKKRHQVKGVRRHGPLPALPPPVRGACRLR